MPDPSPSVSFSKGHFLPWFTLLNQDGKLREIQLYGGACLLVCLVPPDEEKLRSLLAERAALRDRLNKADLGIVFVVAAGVEEVKSLHRATGATISFWADGERAVHDFLGADSPNSPRFVFTDPNLKTLELIDGWQAPGFFETMLERALAFKGSGRARDIDAPVLMLPDVLSPDLCQRVIDYFESGQKYKGTIGVGKEAQVKAETKIRTDVNVRDRAFLMELDEHIGLSAYTELKKIGDFTVSHRERYKIGCYDSAVGGHYGQHRDTFSLTLANRRYSMSIGLNDDFDGGGLVFPEYSDRVYKLPAGSAVIFPSTLFHRVEPVTAGKRYVMVSFLYDEAGAAFRSSHKGHLGQADDTERNRLSARPYTDTLDLSRVYTQSRAPWLVRGRKGATVAASVKPTDEPKDWGALARQALQEGLIAKARQFAARTASEEKQAIRSEIRAVQAAKSTLLVQVAGDSLALPRPWHLKQFDPDSNPFLATTYFDTWPRVLETELEALYPGHKVRVDTNMSQRAFKVTNLAARLPDIFAYNSPDAVILQIGVVDCWLRGENLDQQDVPIDQFDRKIRDILAYRDIACPSTPLVVVGICPTDLNLFKRNTRMNEVIADYNTVLRTAVSQHDLCTFVDMAAFFDPEDPYQLLHLDGIHLSNRGHGFLAELLAPLLREMLSESADHI